MKKFTKLMALILVCITVLNMGVLAAENPAETETTTAVSEVTTTLPEETTDAAEDTTAKAEEPTTEVKEETTTGIQQESTTVPDITTTTPETDEPDATEPEVTDPTQPSVPENPEIVLPKAPAEVEETPRLDVDGREIKWTSVAEADGYNVYLEVNGEWVFQTSTTETSTYIHGLKKMHHYKAAVKSYITVNGVNYESEDYSTCSVNAGGMSMIPALNTTSTKDGIRLNWTRYGVDGYEVFLKVGDTWEYITRIEDPYTTEYLYKHATIGETYEFRVSVYVTTEVDTFYSTSNIATHLHTDHTQTVITYYNTGKDAISLKWRAVEGAASYRVYIYNNGKWQYYKGITKTSYKITGLEASTKYKVKIKACFKNDGKVTWGKYSDTLTLTTESKAVKSFRVGKLKKYFTDGDWSVKVADLKDDTYGALDYTLAVKGSKIFVRYDFKSNKKINDFEYLIDLTKETVYIIFDHNKTYSLLRDDEAFAILYSTVMMGMVLDLSTAKNVSAKTTVYSGKTAVAEIYTDKDLSAKKPLYFINDKIKAMKVTYSDGSSETLKISKINDTPTSSVFKLPKGYKKVSY